MIHILFRTLFPFVFSANILHAATISWEPPQPTRNDPIRILVASSIPPDFMLWGVNGQRRNWEAPASVYLTPASSQEDIAVTTLFNEAGSDANGVPLWETYIGPFNHHAQSVAWVRFVVKLSDNTWLNNNERDYEIPVSAGRVTFDPAQPTTSDRIAIHVHDSRRGGVIRWGVNRSDASGWTQPHPVHWPPRSKPTDDGAAIETPLPRPDQNGVSTLYLGPFNHPEQTVTSLHVAVRWGRTWDTEHGRNYNVGITMDNRPPGGPEVIIEGTSIFRRQSTNDIVTVTANGHDRLELWLNGKRAPSHARAGQMLGFSLNDLDYGIHTLTARALRNDRIAMDTRVLDIRPYVHVSTPDHELPWGATPQPDGSTLFALHAPHKHTVSLIGSFNNWNSTSHVMNVTEDGTWWTTLDLPPGRHYYQYLIDLQRPLADPYARNVLWQDERGREHWKPELARTVLDIGAPAFQWSSSEVPHPDLNNLIVYEFHLADMQSGGFTGMISKLDYIRDMGFTAIGPLPVNEFPGDNSWGYNPAFHFAPESSYGTPDELKQLIDAAHQRGLAVIKDTVFNHMDWAAPLWQLYREDYEHSPFFREYYGENWGFPKVRQDHPALKRYLADVLHYWIREYRVSGFRYDATRFTDWEGYNDWGASWFAYAAKQADPRSIQIAEHLPSDPDLMNQTEMDTSWHETFRWRIREMIEHAFLDRSAFKDMMDSTRIGYTSSLQRMAYTESHDEERVMNHLAARGFSRAERLRRAETAIILPLTYPGPAMIYAGQEFGEDTPKFVGPNPLQWRKLNTREGKRLHEVTTRMLRLRNSHPALQSPNIFFEPDRNLPDGVMVYQRLAWQAAVTVAVNFSREPQTVVLTPRMRGPWLDALSDEQLTATGEGSLSFPLEPGQTRILVLQRNPDRTRQ